jgi:hypothetical protein
VRTGTFWRFGDSDEIRPVVVASWLNVAWQSRRREGLQRELAGDPRDSGMRVAAIEHRTHGVGRVVPTLAYLFAARGSFSLDLRGGGVVDGHGLAFTRAEQSVGVVIELAARACGRAFVGQCEMRKDRGNVPPFAAGRTLPVVVRTRVDQLCELGVLRGQRNQDVFHAQPR